MFDNERPDRQTDQLASQVIVDFDFTQSRAGGEITEAEGPQVQALLDDWLAYLYRAIVNEAKRWGRQTGRRHQR